MRNRSKKEAQNPPKEKSDSPKVKTDPSKENFNPTEEKTNSSGFNCSSIIGPLYLFVTLVLISFLIAVYLQYDHFKVPETQNTPGARPVRSNENRSKKSLLDPKKVFTAEELRKYDGSDPSEPIYIAIFGEVFDVTKGRKHYEKDGSYNGFAGRDGTRAFVTGDFTDAGLRPDVEDLDPRQVADIWDWRKFYHTGYVYVGKLQGLYYDEKGEPTEKLFKVKEILKEAARLKELDTEEKTKWPGCNSRWELESGGEIWCEDMSGGIKRGWDGVPRKRFAPGQKQSRCVCVREDLLNDPTLQEYEGCEPTSKRCKVDLTPNKNPA